jgi:hypothetical protein
MTDQPSAAAAATAPSRSGRPRQILSVVAMLLACLSILLSTVAVWTHQVALNTDRFTALVANVAGDPALIGPISGRVSSQVVIAIDLEARLADKLPGPSKVLAPAMAAAVEGAIDRRLQVALANPRVQAGLLTAVSFTHERIVRVLRDEGDALTIVDGYIYLNVLPIVGQALAELQAIGIIPADIALPDLTDPEAPQVLAERLETALGVTLPATFGMIKLMPADRLVAARTYVKIFDFVVLGLLLLTVVLIALALWLAPNRRWMLVALGIGTIVAFLLARLIIGNIIDAIVAGVADPEVEMAFRTVLGAVMEDLRSVTFLVLLGTLILTIAAFIWGFRGRLAGGSDAGPSAA